MPQVTNKGTRERCEICSELTIETPERRQWVPEKHKIQLLLTKTVHIMKTGVIRAGFSVIFEPVGKIVGFYQNMILSSLCSLAEKSMELSLKIFWIVFFLFAFC